jgi:hypothetical protein
MRYNKNILIEGEKEHILSLYRGDNNINSIDFVISDWVSPDDKYVIFLDNLIDVQNKKLLGNIWENFDNFKLFLKHSFEVSDKVPTIIKESVINNINKLLLTESTQDYSYLKPYVKELIREFDVMGGIKDFGHWGKEQLTTAITGATNFAKTVGSGAADFVKNIAKGDFNTAFDIIGKGVLYLMRSIRSFMYHPVGMVIDAIFVTLAPATVGVTEVLKWLPWLVIVMLDILEITNIVQPEEDLPIWMRFILLGVDVLGLVTTGAVSKGAKSVFKGLGLAGKSIEEGAQIIAKNPEAKSLIMKMLPAFEKLPSFFEKASIYLKNSKLGGFFSKAFSSLGSLITKATTELQKLIGVQGSKALKAGAMTTGLLYGVEKLAPKAISGVKGLFGVEDPSVQMATALQQSTDNLNKLSDDEIKDLNLF